MKITWASGPKTGPTLTSRALFREVESSKLVTTTRGTGSDYTISSLLRIRGDESEGEEGLGTPTSVTRSRDWLLSRFSAER